MTRWAMIGAAALAVDRLRTRRGAGQFRVDVPVPAS